MKMAKRRELERAGWRVGPAEEFLQLSEEEQTLVEIKLALAGAVKAQREKHSLSQGALAARMKSLKSGWQAKGFDFNSGWNWHPRNQGWSSCSSMISTNFRSGDIPAKDMPASFSTGTKSWLTS